LRLAAVALTLALAGALSLVAHAAPLAAPNDVATKQQLRGHLPDLGETPSLRTFVAADAYDSYRASSGQGDVFPPANRLFMSFDKEILALYTRGNDSGGRCLRSGTSASLSGDTVTLDLQWEAGTCGAPATAHYPFVLVSLSRTLESGTSWIQANRMVCAAPPGISPSACATVTATGAPAPTPSQAASGSPSPSATAAATATVPATASPTATPARTPSPTVAAASPSPTPRISATPSGTSVAVGSPSVGPAPSSASNDLFLAVILVALGFGLGAIFILSTRRSGRR
jgi:hypothetical protein